MNSPIGNSDSGFSLVEVLVAFTLLAVATLLFEIAISRVLRTGEHVAMAIHAADASLTHLEDLAAGTLSEGAYQGVYPNGMLWLATVKAIKVSNLASKSVEVYWVTLSIFDKNGRLMLSIETAQNGGGP